MTYEQQARWIRSGGEPHTADWVCEPLERSMVAMNSSQSDAYPPKAWVPSWILPIEGWGSLRFHVVYVEREKNGFYMDGCAPDIRVMEETDKYVVVEESTGKRICSAPSFPGSARQRLDEIKNAAKNSLHRFGHTQKEVFCTVMDRVRPYAHDYNNDGLSDALTIVSGDHMEKTAFSMGVKYEDVKSDVENFKYPLAFMHRPSMRAEKFNLNIPKWVKPEFAGRYMRITTKAELFCDRLTKAGRAMYMLLQCRGEAPWTLESVRKETPIYRSEGSATSQHMFDYNRRIREAWQREAM